MADINKTPLGLSLWEIDDKPRMEHFKKDNEIIDELLTKVKVSSGSWTPSIYGQDAAGSFTYEYQSGRYYRIGDLLHVTAQLRVKDVVAAPSGYLMCGGLNFTHASTTLGPLLISSTNLAPETDHYYCVSTSGDNFMLMRESNKSFTGVNATIVQPDTAITFSVTFVSTK